MRKFILPIALLAFMPSAFAQQQQQTPEVQALYEKLREADQVDVQHLTIIVQLQTQLKAAQDELAKLKAGEAKK